MLATPIMILILTEDSDSHADEVEHRLRRRGAELLRLDPKKFPSILDISIEYSATGKMRCTLYLENAQVNLESVKSVWYRRPNSPVAGPEITDNLTAGYVVEESKVFLNNLWNTMECLWVPAPPSVLRKAELKASQLKLAGSLGFDLPPTLITNNPQEFLEFYCQHNGNIISKVLGPALYRSVGDTFNRYTQVVTKRDVAHWRTIRFCPVIFQAYVLKRIELRITVVGREVFAAEIHSQHSNQTRHDWRHYDQFETPYFPHELPAELRARCLDLVERLGLCYGAIDMVLTPDGRYVFLEINPNGQYLWIEQMTGLPISEAICDLLMSGARVLQTVPPASNFVADQGQHH
jgi:glutathione synthase/RimK-type ligase-like ATP-grasp enzyme